MDCNVDPMLEGSHLFDATVGPSCGVWEMGRTIGEKGSEVPVVGSSGSFDGCGGEVEGGRQNIFLFLSLALGAHHRGFLGGVGRPSPTTLLVIWHDGWRYPRGGWLQEDV